MFYSFNPNVPIPESEQGLVSAADNFMSGPVRDHLTLRPSFVKKQLYCTPDVKNLAESYAGYFLVWI